MWGWDAAYEKYFQLDRWYDVIPNIPVEDFKDQVTKLVDAINAEPKELHEFDAFQRRMTELERTWRGTVLIWVCTSAKWSVSVNWSALKDDPRRYAVVHTAMEEAWNTALRQRAEIPTLPMLCELVDQY